MLKWFLGLIFVMAALKTHANPCETALDTPISFNQIMNRASFNYDNPTRFSLKETEDFAAKALPALRSLAEQNGVTPLAIVDEYLVQMDLLVEQLEIPASQKASMSLVIKRSRITLDQQLNKIIERQKLKANHWQHVRNLFWLIRNMGLMATYLEQANRRTPSFNPFAPTDGDFLDRMFSSLDDTAFDRLVLLTQKLQVQALQTHAPDVVKTPLAPAETTFQTPLVPSSMEGTSTDIRPAAPVETDQTLRDILKLGGTFSTEQTYEVVDGFGRLLKVRFSPALVKAYRNGERSSIQRLLRAMYTGRGMTGIKALFDIGPHIIELKAVMRGHKRILGCLEGVNLYLKSYEDLPASRNSYFKLIPSNFCQ